jgi:hypothetical protein
MKLKWSAIVFGALIDIAISIALGLTLLIAYATILASNGVIETDIQLRLSDPLSSSVFATLLMVIGAVTDGFSGYLTAKFAGYLEYWHTLFMIMTVMFLHVGLSSESMVPFWYELTAQVLGVIAALYGASLVKKQRS